MSPQRYLLSILLLIPTSLLAAEESPRPLSHHPGNIFLAGEDVTVAVTGDGWELTDADGKPVAGLRLQAGRASLGKLPVGYYELRRTGSSPVTLGVVTPLAAPTPPSSPICIDVAMSWFYKGEAQKRDVASLCRLAGINWVRDRLSWGEIEPRSGQFATSTRYDESARIQSEAGLRVLQVNHSSPGWANKNGKRFPLDLRDAYRFHKEIARRWQGQVLAFEPWNEADIDMFGGHTGAEMAAMQKASYLGLKAGNPQAIACLNVFAVNRPAQLDDLAANEAFPYFDTCNLHHYIPLDRYPAWYASFRKICAGRPLWVSEFAMPVPWAGDKELAEPTPEDLTKQARRVPMVLAASLHEGTREAFYFMLPHYVEGKTQFGIIHRDLTPRPAYLALAAAGRLLADARPLGRLKDADAAVHLYAFTAKPDGQPRTVLVAWTTTGQKDITLPDASAIYDHLGRPRAQTAATLHLTDRPVYALLPPGSAAELSLEPSPTLPAYQPGTISPIVMQALGPADKISLDKSAYRIRATEAQTILVFLYNFSEAAATGKLTITASPGMKLTLPESADVPPGERKELSLSIDCGGTDKAVVRTITIHSDFGPAGKSVLSFRVLPE